MVSYPIVSSRDDVGLHYLPDEGETSQTEQGINGLKVKIFFERPQYSKGRGMDKLI